jgi:predicted aconitase with swiveling domain
LTCVFQTAKLVLAQGMVMSDTPIRRDSPANLDRVSAAHQRRARIIAQLHEQAIAEANKLSAQHQATRTNTARNARRKKAEAWFCAAVFLLALGCIVTVGCVLATTIPWQ